MSNQSQVSQSISDAYFTPEVSSEFCVDQLQQLGWVNSNTKVLEPCVGDGSLVKHLPTDNITACDLIDHGYPNVEVGDYLERAQDNVDLVFTNPPFGRMGSLALKIMNKAMSECDRVAMILPSSFRKISIIDRINPWFHPVYDNDLPNKHFRLPNGETRWVNTIFQCWERKEHRRPIIKDIFHYSSFTRRVSPTDAEFAFRTQGASAGRVLNGLDYNPASTAFLRGGLDRIKGHDWTGIASQTAGIPAIGLMDVAYGLHLEDQGIDLTDYLKRGIVSSLINT